MTTTVKAAVTYGLDADAYLVARAVDRALEGFGYHVSVDDDGVWFCRRGEPASEAVTFLPGEQLTVMSNGAWRIEPAPVVTS